MKDEFLADNMIIYIEQEITENLVLIQLLISLGI